MAAPSWDRAWDRFARWGKWPARAVLAVVLALCVAATLVPIHSRIRPAVHASASHTGPSRAGKGPSGAPSSTYRKRDADLALYDRVIARLRGGEAYYGFIVEEQRRSHYPATPGFVVRLPTLAWAEAAAPDWVPIAVAAALFVALLVAWWRRLGEEPCGRWERWAAMGFIAWLANRSAWPYYLVLHEVWAGLLLALAFALHRPGRRWLGAFLAAALALAIRELALPFVLLMGAFAFVRRDWKEGLAWTALVAVFAGAMAVHFRLVAGHVLPTDKPSASWLALRGLSGWFSDTILPSNLRYIDHRISAVLVVLALLGWAGWRSAAGRFGFLFYAGYAVLFMVAGRWENFYWGWIVAPALMAGLAFAPRALLSLARAGFPEAEFLRRPLRLRRFGR
jgi:hypothetical protein